MIMIPAIYSSASAALMFLPCLPITIATSNSKIEFFEMVGHANDIARALYAVMIGKIKDWELIKLRNHWHFTATSRCFHVLAKGVSIAAACGKRYGRKQLHLFERPPICSYNPATFNRCIYLHGNSIILFPIIQNIFIDDGNSGCIMSVSNNKSLTKMQAGRVHHSGKKLIS